jgi:hypothetical protein
MVTLPDHDAPTLAQLERATATTHRIEAWLTTGKCAVKLPARIRGAPVLALRHELTLPGSLVEWIACDPASERSLSSSPAGRP